MQLPGDKYAEAEEVKHRSSSKIGRNEGGEETRFLFWLQGGDVINCGVGITKVKA